MTDPFGFSEKPTKPKVPFADKLKGIVPAADPSKDVALEKVDRVADDHGFRSREAPDQAPAEAEPSPSRKAATRAPADEGQGPARKAPAQLGRRPKETGPYVALNTRAPVRVAEPFQIFCDNNRYSYWEAIEELMKRAGLMK